MFKCLSFPSTSYSHFDSKTNWFSNSLFLNEITFSGNTVRG